MRGLIEKMVCVGHDYSAVLSPEQKDTFFHKVHDQIISDLGKMDV
jgi:hypothetical protein